MAVDGTYHVEVEFMGKKAAGKVTLKADGGALEGTVEGLGMVAQLQNGTVSGDSFAGQVEGDTPLGHKKFKVKGQVAGDKISGELSAMLLNIPFTGERI